MVKGYTGADIQAAIDAAKPPNAQAAPRTVTLPPGEYEVTSPIMIEHPVHLVFDGAHLKASGEAAIVITGNGAQFSQLDNAWIYGEGLKRGIVCQSSLVTMNSTMVSGADVGILLESGLGKRLEYPAGTADWYGCDFARLYNVAIWNCITGIRAHGSDTNNLVAHGVVGQTTTTLFDDNTLGGATIISLYHENGRMNDASDDPVAIRARSAAGATVAIGCGSDGPRMQVDTNAVLLGEGFRVDGQHMKLTGNGLNRLQVTNDDRQAGLLDGPMSNWSRQTGEVQLFGQYPSDVIGDGNWPQGWRCFGAGPSRAPGLALPGEHVTGRRGAWVPQGLVLGAAPLQSTVYVGMGPCAPTDGTWVQGDRVLNNCPTWASEDGWVCIEGGSPGKWRPMR